MEERHGESSSHVANNDKSKEKETLWSSILASTGKNNRAGGEQRGGERGTAKRVIVMGPHQSGRSTLIASLGRRRQLNSSNNDTGHTRTLTSSKGKAPEVLADEDPNQPDLGLSFEYIDLGSDSEQAEEDTPSHLSIYSIPSGQTSSTSPSASLLPLALTAYSLLDTVVVITIDWEKPWLFLRQLHHQLEELRQCIESIEKQKGKRYVVQEGREHQENYFRTYVEPTISKDASGKNILSVQSSLAASTTQQDRPPLPTGTLDVNLGVAVVVVCTKSDNIQQLERSAQLSEEQIDYIQQALRTVCLKYGAALIFTSHTSPPTFSRLRSYLLHRLYTTTYTSASTSSLGASTAASSGPDTTSTLIAGSSSNSRTHAFLHRANAIERDSLLIPAGWDTWGKIRVLREGYDASRVQKGWMQDCGLRVGAAEDSTDGSALEEYENLIRDVHENDNLSKPPAKLDVQYEQDFFKAHYEIFSREISKASAASNASGPRPSLQFRGMSSANGLPAAGRYAGNTGVVGPMSSGGLSLPSVEKALERESGTVAPDTSSAAGNAARSTGMNRRESNRQSNTGPMSPALLSPGNQATSPTPGSATQPQNEVLANFFQSLLNARTDRTGAGSPVPGGAAKSPTVPTGEVKRSDSRTGARE